MFDLKGSLRNRNVKTDSGKESCEVVLLDENLLKLIHDNPLYIRSHCKAILRAAIHSDAYFLSSHLIIDYSLLVGRDDATDQLVVGIIGEKTSEVKDHECHMLVTFFSHVGDEILQPPCCLCFMIRLSGNTHLLNAEYVERKLHLRSDIRPAPDCFSLSLFLQITLGHLPGTRD